MKNCPDCEARRLTAGSREHEWKELRTRAEAAEARCAELERERDSLRRLAHEDAGKIATLEAGAERLREAPREVLGVDTPWPLADVLERAADAIAHLLHDHDCDRHGWELDAGGVPRLKHYAERLRALAALPTKPEGGGA